VPRIKILVQLDYLKCINTEDVTGADTVFLVGGSAAVKGKISKEILTTPVWINDGETKTFRLEESFLFDGDVSPDDVIAIGVRVFDEDLDKDWPQKRKIYATAIAAGLLTLLATVAATPAAIIGAAVLAFVMLSDKDDILGDIKLEIPAMPGEPYEKRSYRISKSSVPGWSDWDYEVGYSIRRFVPKLNARIEPRELMAKQATTVTVFTEDAETRVPVQLPVLVDGAQVGVTATPFTHTFQRNSSIIIRDTTDRYFDTSVPVTIRFPLLHVSVEGPAVIPANERVELTVWSVDAKTNAPVSGELRIHSPSGSIDKYPTNTTFTYTFRPRYRRVPSGSLHARRRPPDDGDDGGGNGGNGSTGENDEIVVEYPQGTVVADGYEKADVPFVFEDVLAERSTPSRRRITR
jgi:hypothetical protein